MSKTDRLKGDECILGAGDFVDTVLRHAEEDLQRRDRYKLAGYGLDELARDVAGLFDIDPA